MGWIVRASNTTDTLSREDRTYPRDEVLLLEQLIVNYYEEPDDCSTLLVKIGGRVLQLYKRWRRCLLRVREVEG